MFSRAFVGAALLTGAIGIQARENNRFENQQNNLILQANWGGAPYGCCPGLAGELLLKAPSIRLFQVFPGLGIIGDYSFAYDFFEPGIRADGSMRTIGFRLYGFFQPKAKPGRRRSLFRETLSGLYVGGFVGKLRYVMTRLEITEADKSVFGEQSFTRSVTGFEAGARAVYRYLTFNVGFAVGYVDSYEIKYRNDGQTEIFTRDGFRESRKIDYDVFRFYLAVGIALYRGMTLP